MLRKILMFVMFLIIFQSSTAITLDELVNSYNFSYRDKSFELKKFEDSYVNNSNVSSFNLSLDFNNKYGDYLVLLDFYGINDNSSLDDNQDPKITFRVLNKSYFSNGNNMLNFQVPIKYNFSGYDIKLKFYQDGNLVFRDYYESKVKLDNFAVTNLTIDNMVCFRNENQSFVDYEIFYLGYEEVLDEEGVKIDKLIFNFETLIESGEYEVEFYLNNNIFYDIITIENDNFDFEISSEDIYDYVIEGEFDIQKILLKKGNKVVSGIVLYDRTKSYSLYDFVSPDLPDLKFTYLNYNVTNNLTNASYEYNISNVSLVNVSLINNGSLNAFGVLYKVLNEKYEIVEEKRITQLLQNETYFIGSFNLSEFYILVDYTNEIIEKNESNNMFIWPIIEEKTVINDNLKNNKNIRGSSNNRRSSNKNIDYNQNILENSKIDRKNNRDIDEFNQTNDNDLELNNKELVSKIKKTNNIQEINNDVKEKNDIKKRVEISKRPIEEDDIFILGTLSFIGIVISGVLALFFLL